jgi:hypothetical protein
MRQTLAFQRCIHRVTLMQGHQERTGLHYKTRLLYTGMNGRPKLDIGKEQIEYLLYLTYLTVYG